MTSKAENTSSADPAIAVPALVLYGLDQQGKPHASAFKGKEAELAAKAAGLMGMRVLQLGNDATLHELALKLPKGRVFASGKAFAPFVKKPLYEQLCAIGGVPATVPVPRKLQATAKAPPAGATAQPDPDLPLHWSAIRPGSLVLAAEGGPSEGWFEALVVEDKGEVFVLRWRDWPDYDLFLRRRNQLGLLPHDEAIA